MKIEHGTWHILKIISVLSRLMDTLHNVSYYAQKKAAEIFDNNYLDYVWNHLDHDCTWAVLWFPYANYKSANFFLRDELYNFRRGSGGLWHFPSRPIRRRRWRQCFGHDGRSHDGDNLKERVRSRDITR
jgi:hypothetical protein